MRPGRAVVAGRVQRRTSLAAAGALVVLAAAGAAYGVHRATARAGVVALPLRTLARVRLPGSTSRFDYASIDPGAHRLFLAHLGASELLTVDTATNEVARRTPNLADVHGVLVVPALHRVYATATGTNELVALDESTGAELWRAPTGAYPDGIAYAATTGQLWVSNEVGGSETVLEASTGGVLGTVPLGGEVGNVAFDPGGSSGSGAVLVDVQSENQLVTIDPNSRAVLRRTALSGCDHDHGLAVLPAQRLAFVACDANAALLVLDLTSNTVTQHLQVGRDPDVLAVDPDRAVLLVSAESGVVAVLAARDRSVRLLGRGPLAAGAHVVAVDPGTGRAYWPLADVDGHPELLVTTTAGAVARLLPDHSTDGGA